MGVKHDRSGRYARACVRARFGGCRRRRASSTRRRRPKLRSSRHGRHGAATSASAGIAVCSANIGVHDRSVARRRPYQETCAATNGSTCARAADSRSRSRNGSMQQFTGGSLQMRGGYVLHLADGSSIDLRDLSLRVRERRSENPRRGQQRRQGLVLQRSRDVRARGQQARRSRSARRTFASRRRWRTASAGPKRRTGKSPISRSTRSVQIAGDDVVEGGQCDPYPWPGTAVTGVSPASSTRPTSSCRRSSSIRSAASRATVPAARTTAPCRGRRARR